MAYALRVVKLNCKRCGHPIASEDINIDRLIAKCDGCHAVFGFADDVPGAAPAGESRARRTRRSRVPLPASMTIEDSGVALRIVHRWWRPMFIFTGIFSVFWCGFLVVWYSMALGGGAPVVFLVFPLLHVAAGIFLVYFTIAGFLNSTYVDVSGQEVRVAHAPLPWPGNRTIPSHALEQLYVMEQVQRGKNGAQTSYHLHAIDKKGKQLKVLSHLAEPEQALYVEQAIEERLGIEDRAVPGQYNA